MAAPCRVFFRRLRGWLPDAGSIVTDNAQVELARLRECCQLHPEFSDERSCDRVNPGGPVSFPLIRVRWGLVSAPFDPPTRRGTTRRSLLVLAAPTLDGRPPRRNLATARCVPSLSSA